MSSEKILFAITGWKFRNLSSCVRSYVLVELSRSYVFEHVANFPLIGPVLLIYLSSSQSWVGTKKKREEHEIKLAR
jgi:hypothetical protein